ncbi:MAG: hypothetical protein WCF84_04485 [Anaerolineae bacterium]
MTHLHWSRLALVLATGAMLLASVACVAVPPSAAVSPAPSPLVPSVTATGAPLPPTPQPTSTATMPLLPTTAPTLTRAATIATTANLPTPPHANVVITPGLPASVTTVRVGQVIQIRITTTASWQVSYDPTYLVSLQPESQMQNPGPAGWFFRALAPGESDVTLTGIAPPCTGGVPCPPPNVPQLSFTIKVVP